MKTDFYNKAILTLIALFLGVLAFDTVYEAAIPEAQAKTGKWECKGSLDMGITYDFSDWNKFYANKAGWTFMTIAVSEKDEDILFCGRP